MYQCLGTGYFPTERRELHWGRGGGTLIFQKGLDHFWGVQIIEFHLFWGFQKNEYFLWYEDFVDIWGGGVSSQKWLVLGVISMHFRVFS